MNSLLKFRAWDEYKSDWTSLIEARAEFHEGTFPTVTLLGGVIVEQFTGLLDKNGVEIYEGDVVIPRDTDGAPCVVRRFSLLGFDGGGAAHPGFYLSSTSIDMRYEPPVEVAELEWALTLVGCEVVGNIHESVVGNNERR